MLPLGLSQVEVALGSVLALSEPQHVLLGSLGFFWLKEK